ncbi:MAG: flagellar type III secretion system protein FlhB [Pseudomonadota bacterium]
MSGEDGAERSHEPTPQKLQDARQKGEIVKSQDLAVGASYLGVLLCLILLAPAIGRRMADLGGTLLAEADRLSGALLDPGPGHGAQVTSETLIITVLLTIAPAALVLAVLFAQRAFVFAPTKLMPKLARISLTENAKNKFGPTGLFEFAKSGAKMILFGGIMAWFLWQNADRLVSAAALEPRMTVALMPRILLEFAIPVTIVSLAIAAVDYAWQHHSHLAKNRMTRQEVLDETKQSEGDPALKARRRQRAQEIAMNTMLADVPDATVIVVNPTHYAVALKWSPLDPTPPVCVAKGVDLIAARIREAAAEAGVPIFSDPPTARALHASVDIGAPIDRAHFAAVAAAIRFARTLQAEGDT